MDMLVIIVRVPLLVKPWIGCEFLGIRIHNSHICDRTFRSTVRFTPVVLEPELYGEREGIIGMIGSKRNSPKMTSEPNQPTKRSAITNIRHLITRNPSPAVKEIVQSSSLQQCGLQATTSEQYVTVEIPQDLIREYLAQNYTHLHLGAVTLILTLHGRKGLPMTAKIALLDTTFKEYQQALIGALVTTLTNGSVILTISPDFTMRLTDLTLSQRIKIQVQLIGATQDAAAEQATLHHQVLYRVQDHALDLKLPNSTGDALLMFHDKNHGPGIVNIPRMITTEELSSIVPLEWITNYEKAFPQQIPNVHTTAPPRISRASDGTVTTVFQKPGSEGQSSFRQSSFQRICMISPISIQHTAHPDDPPVHYYENGKPVYVSFIQGHFIWDVDPSMCVPTVIVNTGITRVIQKMKIMKDAGESPRRKRNRVVLFLEGLIHQMS
ncbi:hypothetical protein PIB30_029990 [Stylosanthes scabra]|uniref:Uncharacterized protein n=1 Tax=Stylosanthes scabra TaxID=79078 RepID=A0ABU6ZBM9_9FABA|nr:hypothetical protein [Stylosanthes scabra]